MLIVSPSTASAMALHATSSSWVMFVQVNPPAGGPGPIKIEGVKGTNIAQRLRAIVGDNPFEAMLIGLIATPTPMEHASAIGEQYGKPLHDDWYEASADLIAFIQHVAQAPLQELLARTHPGAMSDSPVDIEDMAKILDVSVPTVRRMVTANEIPYLRFGRMLRFVPADVIASLRRGR